MAKHSGRKEKGTVLRGSNRTLHGRKLREERKGTRLRGSNRIPHERTPREERKGTGLRGSNRILRNMMQTGVFESRSK